MNWKEFLTPDWKKIGLFILFSFIFLVVIISSCNAQQRGLNKQREECLKTAEEGACVHADAACLFEEPLQKLIIVAIPIYLISCLIISTYNKSKRKRRKK